MCVCVCMYALLPMEATMSSAFLMAPFMPREAACTHVCMHTHICMHAYKCVYMFMCVCVCVCMYALLPMEATMSSALLKAPFIPKDAMLCT